MPIVKMKRLRLAAMRENRDEILRLLQHTGCVEVEEPEAEERDRSQWAQLTRPDGKGLSLAKENYNLVNNALSVLRKYAPAKEGLFRIRPVLSETEFFDQQTQEKALETARALTEGERRMGAITAEEGKLQMQKASLAPWIPLDVPLDCTGWGEVAAIFGTVSAKADYASVVSAVETAAPLSQMQLASSDGDLHYFLLLCHVSQQEAALEAMHTYGFFRSSLRGWTGTAAENDRRLDEELQRLGEERKQTLEYLTQFAPQREALLLCSDRCAQEIEREEAKTHLLDTASTFFLTGWIPEKREKDMKRVLSPFPYAYELDDPQEGEKVPTLLENPKWMRCINMVTEMYSLPAYDGIDPNPLIFFSYIFFFGFMFADVAYGIIIFAISLVVTKKFKPKGTMGYMFQLGQYLGISTAICGIFVGGFFGNVLEVIYDTFLPGVAMPGWMAAFCAGIVVNPVTDPMTVLVIAMVIGAIQLIFGQLVHIYMGFRDHAGLDALLDVVPWWIVFAGIAVVALLGNPWVLVAGFLVLLLTQGRHKQGVAGKLLGGLASWYDITSWLSDILSYARLMALMLATSVIAQVFNTLGALGGRTVIGILMFVVVFAIGHSFNIGVNLIGTYVHAARLHYLEFFGKFYKEGGIPFKPLTYRTKYVDIIDEEEE